MGGIGFCRTNHVSYFIVEVDNLILSLLARVRVCWSVFSGSMSDRSPAIACFGCDCTVRLVTPAVSVKNRSVSRKLTIVQSSNSTDTLLVTAFPFGDMAVSDPRKEDERSGSISVVVRSLPAGRRHSPVA